MKQVKGIRKIKPCWVSSVAFGTCFVLSGITAEDNDKILANVENHNIYMRAPLDRILHIRQGQADKGISVCADNVKSEVLRTRAAIRLTTGELTMFDDDQKIIPIECHATFVDYFDWEEETC